MEPLAFGWSRRHHLVIEGEPIAAAALGVPPTAGRRPAPGLLVGRALAVTVVDDLQPMVAPLHGLPGPSWPLEEQQPRP